MPLLLLDIFAALVSSLMNEAERVTKIMRINSETCHSRDGDLIPPHILTV